MCGFLMRSFIQEVSLITKIMMFSYIVLSAVLILIATKLPSDIQTKLIETQDIILSNPILSKEQSEKIISSVDIIIKRLQKPTLSIYIFNCFKLTPQFQAGSMLMFGILIEYFNAYKKNMA
uniref:Uncharacterized protein n=1 Tax=Acrobeloides nanus TaxID=290746 RepID=A0A914E6Q0_9BILA